jgi:hypothetical protein
VTAPHDNDPRAQAIAAIVPCLIGSDVIKQKWAALIVDRIPGGVYARLAIAKDAPSPDTLRAALNCLDACATDDREPERYRDWYRKSAIELRRLLDPPNA